MRFPQTTPRGAVARFLAGSLAAIAVVVIGGFFALRAVTVDDAERQTRDEVQLRARLVETAALSDALLVGNADALARLDDVVQAQILNDSVVRVKLWTRDGRIVYSDEPELIGRRFTLGAEERELFRTGGAGAELSDLGAPENRYERAEGKLLEAHTVIRTPDGHQLLFETYQRFSAISSSASRLLRALAPPLLGGLLVLLLFQAPLALGMARRLQRGHQEREALLSSAVEASAQERARLAADLHDGVVQDIAGVAFGLAPLAADARTAGREEEATLLDEQVGRLRGAVRGLRTMLVQLHPPNLQSSGLRSALADLLEPLERDGVRATLEVADDTPSPADPLLYRAAREALLNVASHAGARSVDVRVTGTATRTLAVRDDGRGFDPGHDAPEGHVGLRLLDTVVRQAGGTLTVMSAPGTGTTVTLEVPAR